MVSRPAGRGPRGNGGAPGTDCAGVTDRSAVPPAALGDLSIEVETIGDVVRVLAAVRDRSAHDLTRRRDPDGISCFARLYTIITEGVLEAVSQPSGRFRDPAFLIRLDLEFARLFLAALRAHETPGARVPGSWALLFDRRREPGVPHGVFAACGVNAHVNYDLAFALVETWKHFPPNDDRRHDYDEVNEIFAENMDELREIFGAFLAEVGEDGSPIDVGANGVSDLVVRLTRALARDAAERMWEHYDPALGGGPAFEQACAAERRGLDRSARLLGRMIMALPTLP